MSKTGKDLRAAFAELDALYDELPAIACQRRCAIACGPIVLTDLEARRLQLAAHRKPRTIPVQTVTREGETMRERCVYLDAGERCSVYTIRPLICRAWGLVRMLSCMHGCVPDRWLADLAFVRLAQKIERLGGGRVLHTTPQGLVQFAEGRAFNDIPLDQRPEAEIEANAERVRSLRALHGGRIVLADQRIEP